ncbi:hypothetical protein M758_UG109200 [Ceratodon purpureus]|nr:hypothetical protein M758_UG109200 [Ceratodon purpureus]
MTLFVDITQIQYEDDDPKFLKVERMVCDEFDFEPPLKPGWFAGYMRKQHEKMRSKYRKHFEDTGRMHPECAPDKHHALLQWWSSPAGMSKAHRMRELNTTRKT